MLQTYSAIKLKLSSFLLLFSFHCSKHLKPINPCEFFLLLCCYNCCCFCTGKQIFSIAVVLPTRLRTQQQGNIKTNKKILLSLLFSFKFFSFFFFFGNINFTATFFCIALISNLKFAPVTAQYRSFVIVVVVAVVYM